MADNPRTVRSMLFALAIFLTAFSLSGREILVGVPTGPPNLAEALLECSNGDTIVLSEGNYSGAGNRGLSITVKEVRIEGRGEVVIDLEESGEFLFGRDAQCVLSGVRFVNASGNVVRMENSTLEAEGCDFSGSVQFVESTAEFRRCEMQGGIRATSTEKASGSSLTLASSLLHGENTVETIGIEEIRLLNCTLLASENETSLRSDGDVLLNNTIVQGDIAVTGSLHADNSYSPRELSAYGTGNLVGTHPGIRFDGALLPGSPCLSAGNAEYFQENDLDGRTRSRERIDIGARGLAEEVETMDESNAAPRPTDDAWHNCNLAIACDNLTPTFMLTIPCGIYRSLGTQVSVVRSHLLSLTHLTGQCLWSYLVTNGDDIQIASTTACNPATIPLSFEYFPETLPIHSEFPDQFAAVSFDPYVVFTCVEEKRLLLYAIAKDHELRWTTTGAVDYDCAMTGSVPPYGSRSRATLCRQDIRLPLGEEVNIGIDWTGGTHPPMGENDYFDPLSDGVGCRLLFDKWCHVCGAERDVSPLPPIYDRLIRHRAFYFRPSEPTEPALSELRELSTDRGDHEEFSFDWEGHEGHLERKDSQWMAENIGDADLSFRKFCAPITAFFQDTNHQYIHGPIAGNLSGGTCATNGEFIYHITTVGIENLAVDIAAPDNGDEEPPPAPLLRVVGDETENHIVLIPCELTAEMATQQHRAVRAATTLRFTATPTNGDDWPTPDQHPIYGTCDNEELEGLARFERENWRFPSWSGKRPQGGPVVLFGDECGQETLDVTYPLSGSYPLLAACRSESWRGWSEEMPGTQSWNDGERMWRVVVGDLTATLGGYATAVPILLLNDDCESTTAWDDSDAKSDQEREEPTAYEDDDLRPLDIQISSSIFDDREALDRLLVRVTVSAGIRLYADVQKHPVGYQNTRWSSDGEGTYFFRLYSAEEYALAEDSAARQLSEPVSACRLYAEGVSAGSATIAISLVDRENPTAASNLSETLAVTVARVGLIPDYNRDGRIDDEDRRFASLGRPFRIWRNENFDNDIQNVLDFECPRSQSSEIYRCFCDILRTAYPGGYQALEPYPQEIGYPSTYVIQQNLETSLIDGRGDLLDFFPFWIDASEVMSLERPGVRFAMQLRHTRGAMNAVCTDLQATNTKDYLFRDAAGQTIPWWSNGSQLLRNAETQSLSSLQTLPEGFQALCRISMKGIVLCEGTDEHSTDATVSQLEVVFLCDDGDGQFHEIGRRALKTSISSVRELYRYADLRSYNLEEAPAPDFVFPDGFLPGEPPNLPDSETSDVKFFFVHGFAVNATESADWQDRLFKRLHRSGSNARYIGIDWQGDQGGTGEYAPNVVSAFRTAPYFAKLVNAMRDGDSTILLAHSLGNMVACSAIQDHGLQVDTTCMLNAAVAAEAFDGSLHLADELNPMVPACWRGYNPDTWFAEWHARFPPSNPRSRLTWKNRFQEVPDQTTLVNYFDSEDEVLGLWPESQIGELQRETGITLPHIFLTARRYTWQKQEQFKGRADDFDFPIGCTSMTGWGKEKTNRDGTRRAMTAAEANQLTEEEKSDLRAVAFLRQPLDCDSDTISQGRQNEINASGTPALSPPAGWMSIGNEIENLNLSRIKDPSNGNRWPRDDDFPLGNIWSHSDFTLVPYFYTYPLFIDLVGRIGTLETSIHGE